MVNYASGSDFYALTPPLVLLKGGADTERLGCHLAFFETVCHNKKSVIWPFFAFLNVEENNIF